MDDVQRDVQRHMISLLTLASFVIRLLKLSHIKVLAMLTGSGARFDLSNDSFYPGEEDPKRGRGGQLRLVSPRLGVIGG